jgi:hypothetical protein
MVFNALANALRTQLSNLDEPRRSMPTRGMLLKRKQACRDACGQLYIHGANDQHGMRQSFLFVSIIRNLIRKTK